MKHVVEYEGKIKIVDGVDMVFVHDSGGLQSVFSLLSHFEGDKIKIKIEYKD